MFGNMNEAEAVNVIVRELDQRFGHAGREAVLRQLAGLLPPSALQTALAALRDEMRLLVKRANAPNLGQHEYQIRQRIATISAKVWANQLDALLAAHPETPQGSGMWFSEAEVDQVMNALESDPKGPRKIAFEMIQELSEPQHRRRVALAASREPQPTEPTR